MTRPETFGAPRASITARLHAMLRAGERLLLLSDFDGTLTPIVGDPAEARLAPAAREDLRTLAGSGRVCVGIVSGRQLGDLCGRVGLPGLIYAGCHGLEVAGPGLAYRHAEAEARAAALQRVAEEVERRAQAIPGVMVEPKTLSVAIHYRNAEPEVMHRVLSLADAVVGSRRGYTMLRGRKVIEILPVDDWDKGRCVQWIEAQVRAQTRSRLTAVYLGDDVTDERAFRVLHGRGVTVKVGGRAPTLAAHRLGGVDDVHRLLASLAAGDEGGEAT